MNRLHCFSPPALRRSCVDYGNIQKKFHEPASLLQSPIFTSFLCRLWKRRKKIVSTRKKGLYCAALRWENLVSFFKAVIEDKCMKSEAGSRKGGECKM